MEGAIDTATGGASTNLRIKATVKSRVTGMNRSGLSETVKMHSERSIAQQADVSIQIQLSTSDSASIDGRSIKADVMVGLLNRNPRSPDPLTFLIPEWPPVRQPRNAATECAVRSARPSDRQTNGDPRPRHLYFVAPAQARLSEPRTRKAGG